MARGHFGVFDSLEIFNIREIWLDIRDLLAHIEGSYQVRGCLCKKIFPLCFAGLAIGVLN